MPSSAPTPPGFAGIDAAPQMLPVEVEPGWSPRLDPGFRPAWLNWLLRHPDEWYHPTDVWRGGDDWQRIEIGKVAHRLVERAREVGFVIDGDRGCGYAFRRYVLLPYLYARPRVCTAEDEDPLPG